MPLGLTHELFEFFIKYLDSDIFLIFSDILIAFTILLLHYLWQNESMTKSLIVVLGSLWLFWTYHNYILKFSFDNQSKQQHFPSFRILITELYQKLNNNKKCIYFRVRIQHHITIIKLL